MISNRSDRALLRLENFDKHLRLMWQKGAAPAPRPEGADGRERQELGIDGQDWSMCRKIVSRAAGRRRYEDPVADELFHPDLAVDRQSELRGLINLAEQGSLIEGEGLLHAFILVIASHAQGMDRCRLRRREPLAQVGFGKVVHEETDRAAVHAVDRLAARNETVQRLQHDAVSAERHYDIGLVRSRFALELGQAPEGCAG